MSGHEQIPAQEGPSPARPGQKPKLLHQMRDVMRAQSLDFGANQIMVRDGKGAVRRAGITKQVTPLSSTVRRISCCQNMAMQRHLTYSLLSLVLGGLMWPIALLCPVTGGILSSPAFLHARETWPLQIAAMSMAGLLTAQLLRKRIQRSSEFACLALTSFMGILIGALFFGPLFVAGSEFVGLLQAGSFPSSPAALAQLIPASLISGVLGAFFGVVSLPITVPAGICGVYLLRCVLGDEIAEPITPDGRLSRWPSDVRMSFDCPSPLHALRRLRRR